MERTRRVCVAVSVGVATLLAAILLIYTIWGNQKSDMVITGSVVAGEVTQLDRVSALNDGQSLQEGAEAVYVSAHTEVTTWSSGTGSAAVPEEALTETDAVVAWTLVYSKADTGSTVVCALMPGTVLEAPAQEDDLLWYEIYYNGMCGYVPATCLNRNVDPADCATTTSAAYTGTYGRLLTGQSLYAGKDEADQVLATLSVGDVVELLTSQVTEAGGWYQVYWQGITGYICTDQVQQTAEKPQWKQEEETAAAEAELRANIVATARQYLGCSYVWSAAGPSSFDCSGFTMYVMKQYGISLTHSSAGQFNKAGTAISKEELQPGDLVFFSSNGVRATHVGIYIGDGQFIHASSSKKVVTINSLTDDWYATAYFGARSVIG